MLDAFKTCGSSPPKQTGRLRKFECIFTHRAGFSRRISVYAIDDATAERIAWYALVGTRGWRPTWTVKSVAAEKFPQRWAKVSVVAAPPQHLNFNVADIFQKVQDRIAQRNPQGQLQPATIINASVKPNRPHDPRPPRLAVVADPAEDNEPDPT